MVESRCIEAGGQADAACPGIPLALLARYAALPGAARGDLHIERQLNAQRRSAHDLAASLDGPFAATMTRGSLSNAALIEPASASLQALGTEVSAQGETAIRCFGIVGAFNAGVARFWSITLDTTYLQPDGAGQVDLGAETLALKLRLRARLFVSSVSVPVLVKGPLRAPDGRLDTSRRRANVGEHSAAILSELVSKRRRSNGWRPNR